MESLGRAGKFAASMIGSNGGERRVEMPTSPIPDPDTVFLQILLWLGLPSVAVLAIAVLLSLLSWFGLGRDAARAYRDIHHEITNAVRSRTTSLGRRVAAVSVLGGCFVAVSLAISQLVQLMLAPGGPAYGGSYRTEEVLRTAISYSWLNRVTGIVLLGVAITLVGVVISVITGNARYSALSRLWLPIAVVCWVLAVMAGIAGALVLLAALLDPSSGYTINMFLLYAGWIALLLSWIFLSNRLRSLAGCD